MLCKSMICDFNQLIVHEIVSEKEKKIKKKAK
ncbi:MAG: hypothetical protein RLZZ628_271 [Bacteroidota bacterium]|jgi:hypothetical protein